jgi:hypothetical protein
MVDADVGEVVGAVVEVMQELCQQRTILVVRRNFPWMIWCGLPIPAFLNSSRITIICKNSMGGAPQDSLVDGNIVAVVGRRGSQAHKKKYEMNFEYSSFKPMFRRRDAIKHFLVQVDVAPSQSSLPPTEVSIEANGDTCSSFSATCMADVKRSIPHTVRSQSIGPGVSVQPGLAPTVAHATIAQGATMMMTDDASLTARLGDGTNNKSPRTLLPYMHGFAPHIRFFLTKVAVNEFGDCPDSEGKYEEENPSQGFYMNLLVSDNPWTTHVGISGSIVPHTTTMMTMLLIWSTILPMLELNLNMDYTGDTIELSKNRYVRF